jgi:hypothetical protein
VVIIDICYPGQAFLHRSICLPRAGGDGAYLATGPAPKPKKKLDPSRTSFTSDVTCDSRLSSQDPVQEKVPFFQDSRRRSGMGNRPYMSRVLYAGICLNRSIRQSVTFTTSLCNRVSQADGALLQGLPLPTVHSEIRVFNLFFPHPGRMTLSTALIERARERIYSESKTRVNEQKLVAGERSAEIDERPGLTNGPEQDQSLSEICVPGP